MTTGFNKIPVKDLLNETPPRGRISHRPTQIKPDVFTFLCESSNCNRRFASQEALTAHQRRSHATRTQFACPHCSSTFSTSPNLNKHVSQFRSDLLLHSQSCFQSILYLPVCWLPKLPYSGKSNLLPIYCIDYCVSDIGTERAQKGKTFSM